MKRIFLPLLLVVLLTSINQSSYAADDDSRLWEATGNGKTIKWMGKFDHAYEKRVSFLKTGDCDVSGNVTPVNPPVKVSCDFIALHPADQIFIQDLLKNRTSPNPFDKFDTQSAPAQSKPLTDADFSKSTQSKPQEPFDPDKYLAQKESLPEGYTLDPSPQLTPAQIKARDFMADIESQRTALKKKAGALHVLPQFFRWPKGYTADEESEYLTGNMGLINAFGFERKCKKYIREIEALIDSAFKNIQPLPD